jgi:hypothetical protein
MMKAMVPMFVAACCTVAFAQAPDTMKQPAKGMKPDAVTVTGCVAEGSGGHFMLNNATMSHDMKSGSAMSGSGAAAAGAASSTANTASYMLMGGENLKAHVGHKVEVTGSLGLAKPDEKSAGAMKDTKAQELKVQSVKMVSATCP